jgi:hypothetical protein
MLKQKKQRCRQCSRKHVEGYLCSCGSCLYRHGTKEGLDEKYKAMPIVKCKKCNRINVARL